MNWYNFWVALVGGALSVAWVGVFYTLVLAATRAQHWWWETAGGVWAVLTFAAFVGLVT